MPSKLLSLKPACTRPIKRHHATRYVGRPHCEPLYTGHHLPRLREAEEAPRRMGFVHDAWAFQTREKYEEDN